MTVDYRKGEDTFELLLFSKQGNLSAIFSATASNDATLILVEDQGYLLLNNNVSKFVDMFSP